MAGVVGLEPTKCRSQSPVPYRLATPQYMERIERIELSLQVWKTCVLTFTLYSQVVIYKAVYQIPFTTASALYTIPETNPNIKLGLYISHILRSTLITDEIMYYSVPASTDVSGKTFTPSEFTFSSLTPLTVVLVVVASKPFTGSEMLETKPRISSLNDCPLSA